MANKINNGYMTFGNALLLLKEGHKVQRARWNGKNMWISMTQGSILDMDKQDIWTENIKQVAKDNGGKVEILPYLSMKTANNKIQIGWVASQSDMVATDWLVVK